MSIYTSNALENMTINELRHVGSGMGLRNVSAMKKYELIRHILEAQDNRGETTTTTTAPSPAANRPATPAPSRAPTGFNATVQHNAQTNMSVVTVQCGASLYRDEQFSLIGVKLRDALEMVKDVINMPNGTCPIYVNGQMQNDINYVIQSNDFITVIRPSGEKGCEEDYLLAA